MKYFQKKGMHAYLFFENIYYLCCINQFKNNKIWNKNLKNSFMQEWI
jgi:hypothetical protein